jgi:hypothetical protein
MKITRLKIDYDYDFRVFALITAARDYKLAWHMNKTLNLQLRKIDDICIEFNQDCKIYISNFIFEREYSTFRLLKNKACEFSNVAKPFLIPELKDYDYLIMIKDEADEWDSDQVEELLKSIPIIHYIKRVDLDNLKSKENLIFY